MKIDAKPPRQSLEGKSIAQQVQLEKQAQQEKPVEQPPVEEEKEVLIENYELEFNLVLKELRSYQDEKSFKTVP